MKPCRDTDQTGREIGQVNPYMPEKAKNKLNLVLVGCGRVSQTYLQVISSLPECRLRGVVDLCEEKAKRAARNGCKAFVDYRQVLLNNHLDAAIICTPPNTHAEIATFFLENGVHVLCEKPFALSLSQARSMLQKAHEQKRVLMIASKFRYVEDIIKAKELIDSRVIGKVKFFKNVFQSYVDMRDRWNSQKKISGGGVLIDNGSHSVDIVRFLQGAIVKVKAEEMEKIQKINVEDSVRLHLRTQLYSFVTADLSWSHNGNHESYVDIIGTKGMISVGWRCSKYKKINDQEWIIFGKGYNKLQAVTDQAKNFIGSIQGREKPRVNDDDSLECVRVIETAYKSIKMNRWLEVRPGVLPHP